MLSGRLSRDSRRRRRPRRPRRHGCLGGPNSWSGGGGGGGCNLGPTLPACRCCKIERHIWDLPLITCYFDPLPSSYFLHVIRNRNVFISESTPPPPRPPLGAYIINERLLYACTVSFWQVNQTFSVFFSYLFFCKFWDNFQFHIFH